MDKLQEIINKVEVSLLTEADLDNARYEDAGELLPCPFCGKKPLSWGFKNELSGNIGWHVGCTDHFKCGASIQFSLGKEDKQEQTRAAVVAAWNRRTC